MTFSFDFSQDKPDMRAPIPRGTRVLIRLNYTPGGADLPNTPPADRRGQLTKAKEGDGLYLKCECTVLRGPYKGRKFWSNMTVFGGKVDEKGNSIAAGITRQNLRLILDASQGLSTKDDSPATAAKRVLPNGFADLQGRQFVCKVGIEEDKTGKYGDRNSMGTILTVDHKDYPKSEADLDAPPAGTPVPAGMPIAAATPNWGAAAQPVAATVALDTGAVPQGFPVPQSASAPAESALLTAAASTTPATPPSSLLSAQNGALPAWMNA